MSLYKDTKANRGKGIKGLTLKLKLLLAVQGKVCVYAFSLLSYLLKAVNSIVTFAIVVTVQSAQ